MSSLADPRGRRPVRTRATCAVQRHNGRRAAVAERSNHGAVAVLEQMREPLDARLGLPMQRAGLDVPAPVVTARPLPTETRKTHEAWAVASAYHRDPVVVRDGGVLKAPATQRAQLEALKDHGLDPDLVFILRALPLSWTPGTPPPQMVPVEAAREAHQHQIQIASAAVTFGVELAHAAGQVLVALAQGAATAGRAASSTAGGLAMAPLALLALDPLVIGGLVHPSGAVAWLPLAWWDEVDARAYA